MNTPRLALIAAVTTAAALSVPVAHAQFNNTPTVQKAANAPSNADSPTAYKKDAARHLYAAYAKQVHKGKMPPLLYGVAIIETEIDAHGFVQNVRVVRQPAAAEVSPWAVEMIKKAAPFPAPAKMGTVKYTDIWLVDKSGRFQLDTLTEGQR